MIDDSQLEDQARCMEEIAPLLGDFHECWHQAVECYRSYPAEFVAEHDDTTAANCIRAHMWTRLVARFDGRPGHHLLRLRQLNLLNWADRYLFRFKRVDGAGRHQNYQTKQQQDFDDQLELPDIPPEAVRLTSGYQPDVSGQLIERVVVARPFRRSILWAAQINMTAGEARWEDITPARLAGTGRIDVRRGGTA